LEWADRDLRDVALKAGLGAAYPIDPGTRPWYSFEHKGVNFFAANSMAGPRWTDAMGIMGSLGQEQLQAFSDLLATGEPVLFFSHHSGPAVFDGMAAASGQGKDAGDLTLEEVIAASPGNLLALFSGHLQNYKKYDFGIENAFDMGAVADSPAHYAVVEIDPVAWTVTILNEPDLPYPPSFIDFDCDPGEDPVGPLADFVGSFHAVFLVAMGVDNWVLDMLLSGQRLGEVPFVFWVTEDAGSGPYKIMFTEAYYYHYFDPEGGGTTPCGRPGRRPSAICSRGPWTTPA